MERLNETTCRETTRQRSLRYLIGQYQLSLDVLELHPDWRTLYGERLEELQTEYSSTLGETMETEPRIEIKEMPTKELLEAFLQSMLSNHITVRFNAEQGVFVEDGGEGLQWTAKDA